MEVFSCSRDRDRFGKGREGDFYLQRRLSRDPIIVRLFVLNLFGAEPPPPGDLCLIAVGIITFDKKVQTMRNSV